MSPHPEWWKSTGTVRQQSNVRKSKRFVGNENTLRVIVIIIKVRTLGMSKTKGKHASLQLGS